MAFPGYSKIRIVRDSSYPYRAEYEAHLIEGEWKWYTEKSELPHRTLCGTEFPDMVQSSRRTYETCRKCLNIRRRLEKNRRILQYGPEKSRSKIRPLSAPPLS